MSYPEDGGDFYSNVNINVNVEVVPASGEEVGLVRTGMRIILKEKS